MLSRAASGRAAEVVGERVRVGLLGVRSILGGPPRVEPRSIHARTHGDLHAATRSADDVVRHEDVRRPIGAPAARVELGVEAAQRLARRDLDRTASPRSR